MRSLLILTLLVLCTAQTSRKIDSVKRASLMPAKLPKIQAKPTTSTTSKPATASTAKPTTAKPVVPAPAKKDSAAKDLYHVVAKGDNMFQLSKKYGVPVKDLQTLNGLKTIDLKLGQKVLIKKAKPAAFVQPQPDYIPPQNSKNLVFETGVGLVLQKVRKGYTYKALHRTAKIGSQIQVKNLSNSKHVWAKVVGRIAKTPEFEGVIVVLSKSTLLVLGSPKGSFPAEVAFLPQKSKVKK